MVIQGSAFPGQQKAQTNTKASEAWQESGSFTRQQTGKNTCKGQRQIIRFTKSISMWVSQCTSITSITPQNTRNTAHQNNDNPVCVLTFSPQFTRNTAHQKNDNPVCVLTFTPQNTRIDT